MDKVRLGHRNKFMIWTNKNHFISTCGMYYKQVTIVNYASGSVNKLRASLNDDARVVIYNCHMFIVQTTGSSGLIR